jgi:nucleotide-binding universal stress UspA family protein
MISKIIIAFDGSDHSRKAFDLGIEMAVHYSAKVYVLAVVRTPDVPDDVETEALIENATESYEKSFAQLKEKAKKAPSGCSFEIRVGHPADQIVSFADEIKADLIVLGHRGRSEISRWLLGSISKRVLSYAHCSVLIAR